MSKNARQHHGRDADRAAESHRILERVAQEGGSEAASGAAPRQGPAGPATRIERDPIDDLGTRIGRRLGFVLTIGVIVWLIGYLLRGN